MKVQILLLLFSMIFFLLSNTHYISVSFYPLHSIVRVQTDKGKIYTCIGNIENDANFLLVVYLFLLALTHTFTHNISFSLLHSNVKVQIIYVCSTCSQAHSFSLSLSLSFSLFRSLSLVLLLMKATPWISICIYSI